MAGIINVTWHGKTAELRAPVQPPIRAIPLELTPENYREVIDKRPDFSQNPAALWVTYLFQFEAITACVVKGQRVVVTPKPGSKGMDSKREEDSRIYLVGVLKERTGCNISLVHKKISTTQPAGKQESWLKILWDVLGDTSHDRYRGRRYYD